MYKLPSNPTAIPYAKAYFNIRPTSTSREYAFQYPFPVEWIIFFLFWNSLSGISVRIKRVCTERISVAVRITTCFLLHVYRIVSVLTHLAFHPYLSTGVLLSFEKKKKKIHWSALFHFPVPALRQLLLIWKSKESRYWIDLSRWLFMKSDYSSGDTRLLSPGCPPPSFSLSLSPPSSFSLFPIFSNFSLRI